MKSLGFAKETKKYQEGFTVVLGCDEVGRGCLAGPVVACAVWLDAQHIKTLKNGETGLNFYNQINDSKKLSSVKRFQLEKLLKKHSVAFGIGSVPAKQIDKMNIHAASLFAMKLAIKNLEKKLQKKFSHETCTVLVDGKFLIPNLEAALLVAKTFTSFKKVSQEAVVGGDSKVLSIAAASVLAKTYRDRLMEKLGKEFPKYGFEDHKGYATRKHREAIKKFGQIERLHRKSFIHF